MTSRSRLVVVVIVGVSGACDRAQTPPDSTVSGTASVSVAPANSAQNTGTPVRIVEPCPATGRWAVCTLEKRLRQSGFVATRLKDDPPRRPGFSIKPIVYSLGRARLEVFLYDDERAMTRDLAAIDTVLVAPPGSPSPWETQPLLVRSANLAAVLLTQNPRQAERLMLAITAGAPQPFTAR